jgi:hypothetical protein
LQIADRQESLIALFNQALATGKKSLPRLGERNAPGRAIKQPCLQAFFEQGDLPTDVR